MKLRAAFLAERAIQNQDGTFMVWRGGITNFGVGLFPAVIQAALILRLEADPDEARELHTLGLRIVHNDEELPWQESPIAFKEPQPPDTVSYLNMLINFNLGIGKPGPGRIQIVLDGSTGVPALTFRVDQAPLPPGFPQPRRT